MNEAASRVNGIRSKVQVLLMSMAILGGTWALTTAMVEDASSADRALTKGSGDAVMPPQIQVGNDSKCNACVKLYFRAEGSCNAPAGGYATANCTPPPNGGSVMVNYPVGFNVLVKAEVKANNCSGAIVATWTCPSTSANTWSCSPTTYGLWGNASTGLRIMHF